MPLYYGHFQSVVLNKIVIFMKGLPGLEITSFAFRKLISPQNCANAAERSIVSSRISTSAQVLTVRCMDVSGGLVQSTAKVCASFLGAHAFSALGKIFK